MNSQLKYSTNRRVSNDTLKCARLVHARTRSGSAFQRVGAAYENARSPMEGRTTGGRRSSLSADQCLRAGT